MLVEIKAWGHSASVRIPKPIMQAAGLKLNDVFEISTSGNQVVLTRVTAEESDAEEEARLLAMLIAGGQAGGQSEDRYEELSFGPAVGKEVL